MKLAYYGTIPQYNLIMYNAISAITDEKFINL